MIDIISDAEDYLEIFLDEAEYQVKSLKDTFISLAADEQWVGGLEKILKNINIKYNSSSLEFQTFYNVKIEQASCLLPYIDMLTKSLADLRERRIKAELNIIDALFDCIKSLKALLVERYNCEIEEYGKNITNTFTSFLQLLYSDKSEDREVFLGQSLVQMLAAEEKNILINLLAEGNLLYEIILRCADIVAMSQLNSYLVYNNLLQVGEIIKMFPDIRNGDESFKVLEYRFLISTHEDYDKIFKVANISDKFEVDVEKIESIIV